MSQESTSCPTTRARLKFDGMIDYSIFLLGSIFVASILYSSVGHGGASGYLAAMALFGVDPEVMRPAALVMNIFVTLLVLYKSHRQIEIDWRLLKTLVVVSVPFACLGGTFTLQSAHYKYFLGIVLIFAAWRMLLNHPVERASRPTALWTIGIVGIALGFASGLTGIGGGIFLSPLLLMLGWTSVRGSIPIAATFVLANSISGLLGYLVIGNHVPGSAISFVAIAMIGALVGTGLAYRRLSDAGLRAVLGLVLIIAGSKMLLAV